jgi:hypothetical protein
VQPQDKADGSGPFLDLPFCHPLTLLLLLFARRYVATFIKPGIDAARVARGNENDDGLFTLDPLTELIAGKIIEMVFESLPAGACHDHKPYQYYHAQLTPSF